MKKILLLFVLAYCVCGQSESDSEDQCSKTLTNSNHAGTGKVGVVGRLRGLFSRKPKITILDELNNPDLEIKVNILARPRGGFKFYGDFEFGEGFIHDLSSKRTKFTGSYQSVRNKKEKGRFVLTFSTRVQIKDPPPNVDGGLSDFKHIIYWESDLKKGAHLDENIVEKIFERIYTDPPAAVAQEIYNKIALDGHADVDFMNFLLFEDTRDQLKQIILDVIQGSDSSSS